MYKGRLYEKYLFSHTDEKTRWFPVEDEKLPQKHRHEEFHINWEDVGGGKEGPRDPNTPKQTAR